MIQFRLPIILFALLAAIALVQFFGIEIGTTAQFVDGSASGTILANLWCRKKRQMSFNDGSASGTILANLWGRKKRQMAFNDGSASGTILANLLGRKRRLAERDDLWSAFPAAA